MDNMEVGVGRPHFGSNSSERKINPVKELERGKKVTQRVI